MLHPAQTGEVKETAGNIDGGDSPDSLSKYWLLNKGYSHY
jgi:hypothetical protein